MRTKEDLSLPGARFCGFNPPDVILKSSGSSLLVLFRTPYNSSTTSYRRGFKSQVWSGDDVTDGPPSIAHTIPQDIPGTQWSSWSDCRNHTCNCGGCSKKERYRLCPPTGVKGEYLPSSSLEYTSTSWFPMLDWQECSGVFKGHQELACVHKCSQRDQYLRTAPPIILMKCPTCCDGYRVVNGDMCMKV